MNITIYGWRIRKLCRRVAGASTGPLRRSAHASSNDASGWFARRTRRRGDGEVDLAAPRAQDEALLDQRLAEDGDAPRVVGAGSGSRRRLSGRAGSPSAAIAARWRGSASLASWKRGAKKLRSSESLTISRTVLRSPRPIADVSAHQGRPGLVDRAGVVPRPCAHDVAVTPCARTTACVHGYGPLWPTTPGASASAFRPTGGGRPRRDKGADGRPLRES